MEIIDSFCWGLNSSGSFSTKSATWLPHDSCPYERPTWQYKWIWNIDTMPKVKVFMLQMCYSALPVKGTLLRRGCNIDPRCPLCTNDIETIDHLLASPIVGTSGINGPPTKCDTTSLQQPNFPTSSRELRTITLLITEFYYIGFINLIFNFSRLVLYYIAWFIIFRFNYEMVNIFIDLLKLYSNAITWD